MHRKAGILYMLMGIESTSDEVLQQVRKRSTTRDDFQACRLLKQNGIFSVIGHIVGLREETPATFRSALRQLRYYDGDWLNATYVTPHDWTPFGRQALAGPVVEPNQVKWDYRHQVLAQRSMAPVEMFARVKWTELRFHLRPCRLLRLVHEGDRLRRGQQLWTLLHAACVWVMEVSEFIAGRLKINRRFRPPRAPVWRAAGGILARRAKRRAPQDGPQYPWLKPS